MTKMSNFVITIDILSSCEQLCNKKRGLSRRWYEDGRVLREQITLYS